MRRWRNGTSVGRTIYLQDGGVPSKADRLIGVMDTPELASLVVMSVNLFLAKSIEDLDDEALGLRGSNGQTTSPPDVREQEGRDPEAGPC